MSLYESGRPGVTSRFLSVNYYWSLVLKERPDLVLLGGDLSGDGSCGHGYHTAFYYLLCLLDLAKVTTLFISGDNDIENYYKQVTDNLGQFKYVHEVSGKIFNHKGLRIGGISFQISNSKKLLKKTIGDFKNKVDIILCHSPLKRRTSLLAFQVPYVITGHFDNKICKVRNSIFLSFSNDSKIINYGCMEEKDGDTEILYNFYNRINKHNLSFSQSVKEMRSGKRNSLIYSDGIPIPISNFESLPLPDSRIAKDRNKLALSIKYLRGQAYTAIIEFLLESREIDKMDHQRFQQLKKSFFTAKHKLSRTMVVDFIGKKVVPD